MCAVKEKNAEPSFHGYLTGQEDHFLGRTAAVAYQTGEPKPFCTATLVAWDSSLSIQIQKGYCGPYQGHGVKLFLNYFQMN